MGFIVEEQSKIRTVGELVASLQRFPADMPVEAGLDDSLMVYRVIPNSNESYPDPRGRICITSDF